MPGTATITQGLSANTLVAGKMTALRLFADSATLSLTNRIEATILRPDGSIVATSWASTDFVSIPTSSTGPSLVVRVPGPLLPWIGVYYIRARLLDAAGALLASFTLDTIPLLPTKDLRVMVSRLWSGTPTKPGEDAAAHAAMWRMSALYPIRDGVSKLDGSQEAGLRYILDDNPMGPPNQDGHLCPLFASYLNRSPTEDSIDVGITFRFPNPGEGSGGNANHHCPGQSLPFSVIVWGAPLANVFCQETAHAFGLEPPQDPHLDPIHGPHSRDVTIDAQDADQGFDIQYNQPWPQPTYDVMYYAGPDPEHPDPSISLNSWDWEYLRQQLTQLPSTGPTGPFLKWEALQGTALLPFTAAGKNSDGTQIVFVLGSDRALYYRQESSPGWWTDWASLGGHALQDPLAVASNADGRLQVFVRGGDGQIYYRSQIAPSGNWNNWALLGGSQARDFAVGRNADGRLEVVAVWGDGALHDIAQTVSSGAWGQWSSLTGHDLQGEVAIGQNADGRLEAFVVGGDGVVYHRWQLGINGQGGWSDWSSLAHPSLPPIADVATVNSADGRLYAFFMRSDGALSYRAQVVPNGDWANPVHLNGQGLLWPCVVGSNPDGRLEVFVVGGNHELYNRWQIDPSRPDTWSDWVNLSGDGINTGMSLGSDANHQLELFFIWSDGKLYRGYRY